MGMRVMLDRNGEGRVGLHGDECAFRRESRQRMSVDLRRRRAHPWDATWRGSFPLFSAATVEPYFAPHVLKNQPQVPRLPWVAPGTHRSA